MERAFTNLGFCMIHHKENDQDINQIVKCSKQAYKKCKTFYNYAPNDLKIIIAYSEREYKRESRDSYYKNSAASFLMPTTNIVKSPQIIEKTSRWKKEHLPSIILNGFAKSIYCSLVGSWKPLWLSGGIAVYLMGGFKWKKAQFKKEFPKLKIDDLLMFNYVRKTYAKNRPAFYPFAYLIVKHLIKKYGKRKLLLVINEFSKNPIKKRFEDVFSKVYGNPPKILAKNILA